MPIAGLIDISTANLISILSASPVASSIRERAPIPPPLRGMAYDRREGANTLPEGGLAWHEKTGSRREVRCRFKGHQAIGSNQGVPGLLATTQGDQ